ncbi:hypothetical protein B0I35DRAFT_514006 [Stachybotrys elegans]|uniref:Rhodopsin domain-containing protein n=1 Tax=Stachybotrys elegans TaxID=80388 RepID=A0A8K0WNP3_9HYPO|nr:hypothetical protein B0I35DRAFT_514006 [Stachybotrys elegans]
MTSLQDIADMFYPGADPCSVPFGMPPPGETSDFNTQGLRPVVLSIIIIFTVLATVLSLGRLYINLRALKFSDGLVLLAMLSNITLMIFLIVYVRYFRHQWDTPLCWHNTDYARVTLGWQMLTITSMLTAKSATLLLFRQVFVISRRTSIAIWVGLAMAVLLYGSSIVVLAYYGAPHPGTTWEEYIDDMRALTEPPFSVYWAVGQGSAGTFLDLYIFILPLPIIYKLNMSRKRKFQVSALFLVALLGVIASIISIVYRVQFLIQANVDLMYNTGITMLCTIVEMDVALIVCSTPAFTKFVRIYILDSQFVRAIRSSLGGPSSTEKSGEDPNRPRTGWLSRLSRRRDPLGTLHNDTGVSETELVRSRSDTDLESQNPASRGE